MYCGHMKKASEVIRTVDTNQRCPKFLVAPGITRCSGLACARALNIAPVPPK